MRNQQSSPIISTVLLNWNRADLLERTLRSYIATIQVPFELFIIDNGSTDNSREVIEAFTRQHPQASAIFLNQNLGGEALNIGLEMCRGSLYHISENDLEYLPGWDQYVIDVFTHFPQVGQLSLFAPVPTDEEVWVNKPATLKHQNGVVIYEALENVGTSSVIRPEVFQKGIRFQNIVGENGVLFPMDGKFSYDIKLAGYVVAWAHHYLVNNIGHYGKEIQKRIAYYEKTYNGKKWLKVEKLRERFQKWQQQIKPYRKSWLFPETPILPEKSDPSPECPEPRLWSMFDGWTAEVETVEFIYSFVRLFKPNFVVETGTWHGFTAAAIGSALKQNGKGRLVTLEVDADSVQVAREKIKTAQLEEQVTVLQQSSLTYIPQQSIDFLLLDSALEIREQEFRHFEPHLAPNAIIIFHDTSTRHQVVRQQIQSHINKGTLQGFLLNTPRGIAVFQYQGKSLFNRESNFSYNQFAKEQNQPKQKNMNEIFSPICIAGMHRSGTSVLTHMLHKCGLYLGAENDIMPPAPDNPEGFWENLRFVEVNDTILNWLGGSWENPVLVDLPLLKQKPDWPRLEHHVLQLLKGFEGKEPWGWKDPRNSLTLPFWQYFLPQMKLIIPFRKPLDVARSLQKRNGFSLEKGLSLWYDYNQRLKEHDLLKALWIPYELLLQDGERVFRTILEWLGWAVEVPKLQQALALIKPGLHHFHSSVQEVNTADIPGAIKELYFHLLERSPFQIEVEPSRQMVPATPVENAPNVTDILLAIQEKIQKGQQDDALAQLKALAETLPPDATSWNEVGVLFYQLQAYPEALDAFRKAYVAQPENIAAAKNLADLLFQLGELESTARIYQRIFQQQTEDTEAIIFAGKLAYLTGQANMAEKIFQFVEREQPGNAIVPDNLAYMAKHPVPPEGVQKSSRVIEEFIHSVIAFIQQAEPEVEETEETTPVDAPEVPEATELPGCPACGSLATTRARYIADIVTCVDCGLTYLRQLPDASRLKTVYDQYADEFSHMRLPGSPEEVKQSVLRRDYFLDEIERFVSHKGQMLDVGCGWGAFLDAARERGFQPQGIEITPRAAEFARKQLNIPVDTKPLEEQRFESNTFSLITMNHVLEHLPRTHQVLEKVFQILEPGGIFAGMVPNFGSFCSEMEGEYWEWLDPNFHYVHFTPETLRKVLENSGFEVEQLYTVKGDYNQQKLTYCILQKYGELTDNEIKEIQNRLEEEGRGEEIRFIARKPLKKQPLIKQHQPISQTNSHAQPVPTSEYSPELNLTKSAEDTPHFSIVIPVFNQVEYTRKCIEKIYENTHPGIQFEVIVVDNASTDDTPEFLKEAAQKYPNFKFIRSEENLKYAGGSNLGASQAKGEYLVFLNNDTEPQPGWLVNAWNTLQTEKNIGILGAKLLYPDRTVQHCGIEFQNLKFGNNFIWPMHRYRHAKEDNPLVNKREDVHAVTGACLFISRRLFKKVEGFDEAYGMYFEDTDLCFKVRGKGKRVVYEPSVVVIHHEGKTVNHYKKVVELNEKASLRFYQKWEDDLVTIALDVLLDRKDGKYFYFNEYFYPKEVNRRSLTFFAKMLHRLGAFYAFIGGIGDALLFLSTFYDREDYPTIVCAPNSSGAMRVLFNQFKKIKRVYFIPYPRSGHWHYSLRGIWEQLPNCKGRGVTPVKGYMDEWTPELNIFATYGVKEHPQWIDNIAPEKIQDFQVVLQPHGSTRGMVGTKRNIIKPRDWIKLQKYLIENGITPIVIGTPSDEEFYPLLEGSINRRGFNLHEHLRLIRGADVFIGADSWGKTFAALCGIPTYVFKPPRGEDLKDWDDPSEFVFLRPWKSIILVEDFEDFQEQFSGASSRPLHDLVNYSEYKLQKSPYLSPYWHVMIKPNQLFLIRRAGLGDIVMTFPLIRAIKKANPQIKVNFVTENQYKHLVDSNPDIDCFLPYPIFEKYLIFEKNAYNLEEAKFGIAETHQVDAYLNHFKLTLPAEEKSYQLIIPSAIEERISEILSEIQNQYRRSGARQWQKMVLLHPAKGDPNRTWPKERWEELARLLVASGNLVITVGSGSTSRNRGVFVLDAEGVVHLEDQLSPIEFVALCKKADVLISTDSGPIQLAGATDIAIVGIYSVVRGKNRLPYRHGKLGWHAVAVEPACPHAPCYEKMNDTAFMQVYYNQIKEGKLSPAELFSNWCLHTEKFACTRHQITVQQVWEAIQPFLVETMDADAILEKVEMLVKNSEFVQAQKELEKWIRRDDVDARILKRYVELLKERGEWVQYVEWLEKYVQRNPDDAVAANELGVVRWQQNRKQEAISLFKSAVNLNGNHPDHVKNLADALLTEERFEDAIKLYVYLIQKYPKDPEAYERLATLYIENGNYDDARLLLDRAIEHNPTNDYLKTWRKLLEIPKLYIGYNLINQGELDLARQVLEEVLTEHPNNADALTGLGSMFFHQGDWAAAKRVYQQLLNHHPGHPEGLFYIGKIYIKEGNFSAFEQLQKAHPRAFAEQAVLRKVVIEFLLEQERFEEALAELNRYLGDFPADVDGYVILGNLFYEGGKVREARRFYTRALELEPENEELRQLLENMPEDEEA